MWTKRNLLTQSNKLQNFQLPDAIEHGTTCFYDIFECLEYIPFNHENMHLPLCPLCYDIVIQRVDLAKLSRKPMTTS